MVLTTSLKLLGNGAPNFCGKTDSSSSWASIQSIKYSTYLGADTSMGFLMVTPSAHLYSYFGPADIVGQLAGVQNSVSVPYRMFTWLKKSTVFTASHSLMSSPGGSRTASLKFPLPRVASICLCSWAPLLPEGALFLGRKVFWFLHKLWLGMTHVIITSEKGWHARDEYFKEQRESNLISSHVLFLFFFQWQKSSSARTFCDRRMMQPT